MAGHALDCGWLPGTPVVLALAANIGVAVIKLAAGRFTGSAAMLSEGAHSVADTMNEGFLLVSLRRSERPADRTHPGWPACWPRPGCSLRAETSFSTWLYRIVVRRALTRVFRARPAGSFDLLGDAMSSAAEPAQEVERSLTVDAVTAAVAARPPPLAQISSRPLRT